MLERSRQILAQLPQWESIETTIRRCKSWFSEHADILCRKANDATVVAEALHESQQKISNDTAAREITIEDVSMENLARDGLST